MEPKVGRLWANKNRLSVLIIGLILGALLEYYFIERLGVRTTYIKPDGYTDGPTVECLIVVKHENKSYVKAATETWAKECNNYTVVEFVKSKHKSMFAFQQLNKDDESCSRYQAVEGNSSWSCLCQSLRYFKTKQFHWLLITNDQTIAVLRNLKHYVQSFESSNDYYMGYPLTHYVTAYNVLSAGIVLSNGTFQKLMSLFPSHLSCYKASRYWNNEDLYLGKYLADVGVKPMDTRDVEGRGRFHGQNIHTLLNHGANYEKTDYHKKAVHQVAKGVKCCSPELITLGATNPSVVYYNHFFINFGQRNINTRSRGVTTSTNKPFSWQQYLRNNGYSEDKILNMTAEEYYKIWADKMPPEKLYDKIRSEFGD